LKNLGKFGWITVTPSGFERKKRQPRRLNCALKTRDAQVARPSVDSRQGRRRNLRDANPGGGGLDYFARF